MQKEKEQYLNYRRIFFKDSTDVFAERRRREKQSKLSTTINHLVHNPLAAAEQGEVKLGPTPFNSNMGQAAVAALYANSGMQYANSGMQYVNSGMQYVNYLPYG